MAITWAKRLKRVFHIEIETCSEGVGDVRIIASIEELAVIRLILAHLNRKGSDLPAACCRIAMLHWACRPGYLTEEVNSTMTAVPHLGNGMSDFVLVSRIGKKHSCIRSTFSYEHKQLTRLPGISLECWV